MVILKSQITGQDQFLPSILLMCGHFQMIYLAVRQFDIPAVSVIFYARCVGDTVCTRKETRLLIDITDGIVCFIAFSLILGEKSDIAFYSCRIFQFTAIDRHFLSQVDDGIRRDAVITEVLFGITDLRIPGILLSPSISEPASVPLTDLPNRVTSPKNIFAEGMGGEAISITCPWHHCRRAVKKGLSRH